MSTSSKPDTWELADYAGVLRRRWRAVAVITFIGLLIGAAIVALEKKTYTATASVYVAAIPTESRPATGAGVTVDMDTEAQLAHSNAVAQLAAKHLGFPQRLATLRNDISVAVPASTTLLNISCKEPTATHAADCANAVAAAYLVTRRAQAAGAISSELAALRSRAQALLPGVVKANLAAAPPRGATRGTTSVTSAALTRQLQAKAATSQLDALVAQINSLTGNLTSLQRQSGGHLVNSASSPSSPTSPKTALLIPSGLVAGLILGLIFAFVREFRDERIHGAREIERDYGLQALLDVPLQRMRAVGERGWVGSQASGDFSELAEYVATAPGEAPVVLLVAGTSGAEATSLVAGNLAAVLSEARPDVLLVCDAGGATHAPRLLGIEGRSGLAEALAGKAAADEVARTPSDFPDLRVILPGSESVGAGRRRNYEARRNLISELRSQARYVILESSLLQDGSPLFTLAEFADGAIIVVETSSTQRGDIEAWLRHLERIRIPVLGAVVIPRIAEARRGRSLWSRILCRGTAKREPISPGALPAETAVAEQRLSREQQLTR